MPFPMLWTEKKALESVFNNELSESRWAQCSLPTNNGGLSVRYASKLSLPVFLSLASTCNLPVDALLPQNVSQADYSDLTGARLQWTENAGVVGICRIPAKTSSQSAWDTPLCI